MKLKEMLKDLETLNKLNLKYNLANRKIIVLSENKSNSNSNSNNTIYLDTIKDIKYIANRYIESLSNKMINDNWHKDYDNIYYLEYVYYLQLKDYSQY